MDYSLLWIFLIFLVAFLFLNRSKPERQAQLQLRPFGPLGPSQQGGNKDKAPLPLRATRAEYENIGISTPFSYIDQSISTGNKISWDGIRNPLAYHDKFYDNCDKPTNVYFGSPAPLLHQMKPMKVPKDTMFYFANAKFSPECCQGGAPYSTSSGCVCAFAKQLYRCPNEKLYEHEIPGPNSWQMDT